MVGTSSYLVDQVRKFLESFQLNGKHVYFDKIKEMNINGKHILTISFDHVLTGVTAGRVDYTEEERNMLLDALNLKTDQFIDAAKTAVVDIAGGNINNLDEFVSKLTVQLNDSPERLEIPDIKPQYIGKFITMEGIISSLDENPSPLYRTIVYNCTNCGLEVDVESDGIKHYKPKKCSACGEKQFKENDEESAKHAVNYKRMELQQLPERVDAERIAASVECWLIGDELSRKATPGDRVKLTGFIKVTPKDVNSALKDFYVQVNYLHSINNIEIDENKYQTQLQFLMNEQNEVEVFAKLLRSICPSVKGMELIKLGLLLQAVGGEAKIIEGGTRIRGDINIILIGNPGTAKSTLAKWMKKAFRRAIYASNVMSKVGIAAAVIPDKRGGYRIQPGTYMLGNGGLVIIDELEKTPEEDRLYLPGLLDDTQTLSINKGGISKEFKIKTSSLHICNPEGGRWNPEESFEKNVPLAAWLLDRYDLKWLILGSTEESVNSDISKHLLDQLFNSVSEKDYEHGAQPSIRTGDYYDLEFMREYFVACRKISVNPRISKDMAAQIDSLKQDMHNFFMSLKTSGDTKDISHREEGVIFRLMMASAAAHMRDYLRMVDLEIAKALITESMISCGKNPKTGQFDSGIWNGQKMGNKNAEEKSKKIEKKRTLKAIIARLSNNKQEYFMRDDLEVIASREMKVTRAEIIPYIEEFLRMNLLNVPLGMDKHLEMTQTLLEMNI